MSKTYPFLVVAISLTVGFLLSPKIVNAQVQHPLKLSPVERAFVAAQTAVGRDQIRMLLVTEPGRSADVIRKLKAISVDIGASQEDIDIVRAKVPIARLQEVLGWPELTAVETDTREGVDLLSDFELPFSGLSTPSFETKPGVPPSASTPENNPYTGSFATEASQFKAAFPNYDGRGVVIGAIEALKPGVPALTWARSLQGTKIPKIPEFLLLPPPAVTVGPIPEDTQLVRSHAWQKTVAVAAEQQGRASFNNKDYLLPKNLKSQELRMTLFRTSDFSFSPELTVLWAVESHKLWIVNKEQTDFSKGVGVDLQDPSNGSATMAQLGSDLESTAALTVGEKSRWIGIFLESYLIMERLVQVLLADTIFLMAGPKALLRRRNSSRSFPRRL